MTRRDESLSPPPAPPYWSLHPSDSVWEAAEGSVWCDAVKFKEEYRPLAVLYILLGLIN